jgi:hypothetical protein
LHKQFEQHNVYRRANDIHTQSESAEWNIADEAKYEMLDKDIGRAM